MAREAQAHGPHAGREAQQESAGAARAHDGGHSEHGHFGPEMWVIPERTGMVAGALERERSKPALFRYALWVAAGLTILGVAGFVGKAATAGFGNHQDWGFYVAAFAFVFTVTASAPLAACAFRFTKSHWRRPLTRIAELFSVASVVNILLFIPALIALPEIGVMTESGEAMVRRSIWFQELVNPSGWLMAAMVGMAVCSLGILWVSAMPDMAQGRGAATGIRAALYGRLAGGWQGSKRQWQIQKGGLAILGAFYFMLVVFVQFLIVSDFAMAMIPGWKDSILPPFYTVISFQGGLALILLVAYALRRWGGYREYIGRAPFWAASKVLLGLTLLHTYHLFAFFITYWYGRLEVETAILRYLMFDSYLGIFWAQLFLTFFIPLPILLSNHARREGWGAPLAAVFIVAGLLLFHIRIFAAAFAAAPADDTVGGLYFLPTEAFALPALALGHLPAATFPDIWDIMMILGAVGLVALTFRIGAMLLPPLSFWEMKEGSMYQRVDTLLRGRYLVLGKPE